jgi:hypothetical protein
MPETRSKQDVQRELEKIERFRRVASRRANAALKQLEMLLRTSDRSYYSYNDEQVAEVMGKLRQAVDQLAGAYSGAAKSRLKVEL